VQMKTKTGLGLVVLGIGVFVAWKLWTKTRNEMPVNVPVSLFPGQAVTSQFRLNLDGLYLIEIEAERNIPPETLHCLMGVEADAAQCKDIAPAIGATWILSRGGHEIGRGTSLESHTAPVQTGNVARVIGEFPGTAGQDYRLEVAITADGRRLQPAHPRLRVVISSLAKTDFQSASVLIFSISFVCILFGVILLGIAFYVRRAIAGRTQPNGKARELEKARVRHITKPCD